MRRFYVLLLTLTLLAVHAGVKAVPALSVWRTFVQSDGTSITVRLCGDENMQYYVTEDGVPLVREAGGDFCYADTYGFVAKSSGVIAHEQALRSSLERRHVSTLSSMEVLRRSSVRAAAVAGRRSARRLSSQHLADGNEYRGLVVMMEFPDKSFYDDEAYSDWNDILNKEGYAEFGANGSVSDYFRDQSTGLFNLRFDVVGPVVARHNRSYYGADYSGSNRDSVGMIDIHVGELIVEACDAAKAAGVDFSDYDWDGDGEVDQVFVLYAGGGQAATGNPSYFIWPHEYYVSEYAQWPDGYVIDGVRIDTYACSCELYGVEQYNFGELSGLGTFCHEFSHCLGLPDLYNTTGGDDMLGKWDLLSEGSYNANGWCPPNYSMHEKELCGWAQAVELREPATVTGLKSMSDGGASYKVRNDCEGDVDEYYLLENRQKKGWDAYVPGSGLIITHIDYDAEKWYYNIVNDDETHPGVAIIPASGIYNPNDARVAYPYNRRDSLTDRSTPAAKVYNTNVRGTNYMGKPITHITHDKALGTVSFDFMGGGITDGIRGVGSCSDDGICGRSGLVFDAAGHCVGQTDGEGVLDAGLPAGVYIIRAENGTTNKVIKK